MLRLFCLQHQMTVFSLIKLVWQCLRRNRFANREIIVDAARLYFPAKFSRYRPVRNLKLAGFVVNAHSYGSLLVLYSEIFLQEVYHIKPLQPNALIIDGGANIGLSTLYFKRRHALAEVWAFEPNPPVFELLRDNVQRNQLPLTTVVNNALANEHGSIPFFIPDNSSTLNASCFHAESHRQIIVDATRLSDKIGRRRVDLLKLDVEGSEVAVLEDLISSNVIKQIKNFIIECHQLDATHERRWVDVLNTLRQSGWRLAEQRFSSHLYGESTLLYGENPAVGT